MRGYAKRNRMCARVLRLIRSWTCRIPTVNHRPSCLLRIRDTLQITDSTIRIVLDTTMANPETSQPLDCTRVPISNGTYCDVVHAPYEHGVFRIQGTPSTWTFALVVGPLCKTLELQLDAHTTNIVPMFIYLACHDTSVTIRSLQRRQFGVHAEHLSPRILPYLRFPTCTGTIIVPTLESFQIVDASYQLPIRTWECLLTSGTPTGICTSRPSLTQTIVDMYVRLSTALFDNIYILNTLFDPDAVYKTYHNTPMSMNALRAIICKVRTQSERILELQEMLKIHGYITTVASTLSFDIGEMLVDNAAIDVTYE